MVDHEAKKHEDRVNAVLELKANTDKVRGGYVIGIAPSSIGPRRLRLTSLCIVFCLR